jgi:hypothetical protein
MKVLDRSDEAQKVSEIMLTALTTVVQNQLKCWGKQKEKG